MSVEPGGRRTFPIIDLQGRGEVRLSLEQRYATLMSVFKYQYFAVYKHIGRRWGWDAANEVAMEVAAEAVPVIVEGYRRTFGLTGEGAALIAEVLQAEFQAEGSDLDVVHASAEAAEVDVACMLGDALQSGRFDDVDITEGMCHQGCTGWIQEVAHTVDASLEVERHAWMGDGASRCRFTITSRTA